MKKLGRIIVSSLLILFGLAAATFGIVLLLQADDIIVTGFAVTLSAFGAGVVYGGWCVAKGDKIRDIVNVLFLGFP